MTRRRYLTDRDVREIADRGDVDRRTVRRALYGGFVRGRAGRRVAEAIAAHLRATECDDKDRSY